MKYNKKNITILFQIFIRYARIGFYRVFLLTLIFSLMLSLNILRTSEMIEFGSHFLKIKSNSQKFFSHSMKVWSKEKMVRRMQFRIVNDNLHIYCFSDLAKNSKLVSAGISKFINDFVLNSYKKKENGSIYNA